MSLIAFLYIKSALCRNPDIWILTISITIQNHHKKYHDVAMHWWYDPSSIDDVLSQTVGYKAQNRTYPWSLAKSAKALLASSVAWRHPEIMVCGWIRLATRTSASCNTKYIHKQDVFVKHEHVSGQGHKSKFFVWVGSPCHKKPTCLI